MPIEFEGIPFTREATVRCNRLSPPFWHPYNSLARPPRARSAGLLRSGDGEVQFEESRENFLFRVDAVGHQDRRARAAWASFTRRSYSWQCAPAGAASN